MEFATYINPEITIACLIIGFIVKMWLKDVDNRLIPTIVAGAGLVLAIVTNWGNVDIAIAIGGVLSGLASTGMHQMLKQWIDNGGK